MSMITYPDNETIVAFFDIYGFSAFIKENSMERCIGALEEFLKKAKKSENFMLWGGDEEDIKFKIEIFSDSIIFKLDTFLDKSSIDFFLRICSVLMLRGIRYGFPLRGAIGGGYYYKNNDVLVSSALVDAAEFKKAQDWFGTVITPKALKIIKDKYPSFESGCIEVIKYGNIPWKNNDSVEKPKELFYIACPYTQYEEKHIKDKLKYLRENRVNELIENSKCVYSFL